MPVTQRRAKDTRTALLQSARQVFQDVGYSAANVADVVGRAGSSVGSMYHHFGGKAELYLALYDEYQTRQEQRAEAAIRQAVDDGERNSHRLYLAGARAYLHGCWEERDLARLFLTGDGPPGFDLAVRTRFREWARNGDALFRDAVALGDAHAFVLTNVIQAAGREVAVGSEEEAAMAFIDEVLEMLVRLDH